jgi:hypothetical protein
VTGGGALVSYFRYSSLAVMNGSLVVSAGHSQQEAFKRQILGREVKLSMSLVERIVSM